MINRTINGNKIYLITGSPGFFHRYVFGDEIIK